MFGYITTNDNIMYRLPYVRAQQIFIAKVYTDTNHAIPVTHLLILPTLCSGETATKITDSGETKTVADKSDLRNAF
jgi:hypothetical protein